MSRFLLDTNAVIELLRGNHGVNKVIANAEWAGISIIAKLEFLSFPKITQTDADLFFDFEQRVEVVDITNAQGDLLKDVVRLKKLKHVKLPDAIIMASAMANQARLLTADKQLLRLWPEQTMPLPA